jgi:hypothetical protein
MLFVIKSLGVFSYLALNHTHLFVDYCSIFIFLIIGFGQNKRAILVGNDAFI